MHLNAGSVDKMKSEAIIEAENLTKKSGNLVAVDNINFRALSACMRTPTAGRIGVTMLPNLTCFLVTTPFFFVLFINLMKKETNRIEARTTEE